MKSIYMVLFQDIEYNILFFMFFHKKFRNLKLSCVLPRIGIQNVGLISFMNFWPHYFRLGTFVFFPVSFP